VKLLLNRIVLLVALAAAAATGACESGTIGGQGSLTSGGYVAMGGGLSF
jgi:hypothetical protein